MNQTNEQIAEMLKNDIEIFNFVQYFKAATDVAHNINVNNGWWEDRRKLVEIIKSNAPEMTHSIKVQILLATIGLVQTEPSEAVEALRKNTPESWANPNTKDTFVRELAGTIVRIMDIAGELKLPLGEAIIEELKANATRGYRHGGKAA